MADRHRINADIATISFFESSDSLSSSATRVFLSTTGSSYHYIVQWSIYARLSLCSAACLCGWLADLSASALMLRTSTQQSCYSSGDVRYRRAVHHRVVTRTSRAQCTLSYCNTSPKRPLTVLFLMLIWQLQCQWRRKIGSGALSSQVLIFASLLAPVSVTENIIMWMTITRFIQNIPFLQIDAIFQIRVCMKTWYGKAM